MAEFVVRPTADTGSLWTLAEEMARRLFGQLELDTDRRLLINCLARNGAGWAKSDLPDGRNGVFVESVTQRIQHAMYARNSIGGEQDFKPDFTLDPQLTRLFGIGRLGLVQDFHGMKHGAGYRN